jgi:Vitamin K-dependent gamma-carboxylase
MRNFFLSPSDWRWLGALRIGMGVMLAVEATQIWRSLDDLYGPYGFLEAALMNAVAGTSAPSFATYFEAHGWNYSVILHALFALRWVVLVMFTAGFFSRSSTVFLWGFQTLIMFSGTFSNYGVDRYFHLLLFLMMWMPTGAAWSVDNFQKKIRESWASTYALRITQIAILMTYLNAGVAKGLGHEWWNGDAIWRALHMPEFQRYSFLWMGDWPLVPKLLGWATLFFETFYIFGVWIPGVGLVWTLIMISMHLGISAFMGLVNFGITMSLINVALFIVPKMPEWLPILSRRHRRETQSRHSTWIETRLPSLPTDPASSSLVDRHLRN